MYFGKVLTVCIVNLNRLLCYNQINGVIVVSGVDYVWSRVTIKQAPRHFCYVLLRSIFTKPWNS